MTSTLYTSIIFIFSPTNRSWFRLAARHSYVETMGVLATLDVGDEGIVKDIAIAVPWHREAAGQGEIYARECLRAPERLTDSAVRNRSRLRPYWAVTTALPRRPTPQAGCGNDPTNPRYLQRVPLLVGRIPRVARKELSTWTPNLIAYSRT